MAARRLILVMLVLLVLSSAVAALIPVDRTEVTDETTSTTSTTPRPAPSGELVTATIRADAAKPKRIPARKGDQLELKLTSSKPGSVEVVALGVFEEVDRLDPARVDLLLFDQGTYPVRFLPPQATTGGRVIGRIVVGGVARKPGAD
jgi:hypothetical protein